MALSSSVKNPYVAAVDMATANTEYSFTFPEQTKRVMISLRSPNNLFYSWQQGQVAGPSGNYLSLLPGASRSMNDIQFDFGDTLYFSSDTDSQVLEIEYWT